MAPTQRGPNGASALAEARPARAQLHDHLVGFYDSERFFVDSVIDFVMPASSGDAGVLIIATPGHLRSLRVALEDEVAAGTSPPERLVLLDVHEVRREVMVDGLPDPARFRTMIGRAIHRVAGADRPVRIFGEMVAVLWADGEKEAALAVEDLWNEFAVTRPLALFCTYPLGVFEGDRSAEEFLTVCQRHSAITNESYSNPWQRTADGRSVVVLHREPTLMVP